MANGIIEEIDLFRKNEMQIDVYRYIKADWKILTERFEEEGFYNGETRIKALPNIDAKQLIVKK